MTSTRLNFAGHMRRRLQHIVGYLPNRYYDHRHPGPLVRKIIFLLSAFARFAGPNDKWNLHVFAREWIKVLDLPSHLPLPTPRRLFIFTAYRVQFTHDFVLAAMLAWRGHQVTIGYLPKLQSPIKEPLHDHPLAKSYLKAALGDIERLTGGRIRCIDLTDNVDAEAPINESFVKRQCHADTVMKLGTETLDPEDPTVSGVINYYNELGRTTQCIAWSYLSRHGRDHDLYLVPNGTTYETAHFCDVVKRLELPFNSFEKFAFRNTRVINHGDHFLAFDDLDELWNRRQELGLESEPFHRWACDQAYQLLNERRDSSGGNWGWQLQQGKVAQTVRETIAAIGIKPGEKFVLICPNIPFDAGYSGLLTIFPSMREWLIETVRWLLEESDIKVVVRAHPGEARLGGPDRTDTSIAESGLASDRLIVLPAESPVNTYPLMKSCQFGVVFSSTTGIEMAMEGKPVIVGADIYYKRRGFTVDADNRADYFTKLGELCEMDAGSATSLQTIDNAAKLYFLFHFVTQWRYPYDKPSTIHSLPPAELVGSDTIQQYLRVLDSLTLPVGEWREQLPNYINAETIYTELNTAR